MDSVFDLAQVVMAILSSVVVTLHVIAPMTASTKDDKALGWARWLEAKLRLILPTPSLPTAEKEVAKARKKSGLESI